MSYQSKKKQHFSNGFKIFVFDLAFTHNLLPQNSAVSVIYFLMWSCFAKCRPAFQSRPLPPACKSQGNTRLNIADCDFRLHAHRAELTFAFQELFPLKYRPELFRLKCPLDSLSDEMIFKKKTKLFKACTKQSVQDDIKIKPLGQCS